MTRRVIPHALYHWAPTVRRPGIIRHGLLPGKPRTTHAGDGDDGWRASYVCLAEDPVWAWELSGWHRPEIRSWDLWEVLLADVPDRRVQCLATPHERTHEWRVHGRIYKRGVLYVATRHVDRSPR